MREEGRQRWQGKQDRREYKGQEEKVQEVMEEKEKSGDGKGQRGRKGR